MKHSRFIYYSTLVIVLVFQLHSLIVEASLKEFKVKDGQHPTPFPSLKDDKQLQEGQLNYNMALRDSQMPRYGGCWKNALKRLDKGCKHLTDDVQQRLALHFTNCFLEKAGQTTYPCDDDDDGISICLSKMNSNGFTAYTSFFTHVQSMCHFLQAQVWQEETENTVARLSENSNRVVKTLEDTNELQDYILEAQKKSLAQQERLLESSSLLGQALDTSKTNVKDMLEEFRSSTSEQRSLIFEVFDRLSKLQNLVLGEVSGFYSLIFYPTALLTVYLLTSTSRTAAARFWLFVLFGCSLALERLVVHVTVSDGNSYLPADEASKEMYWRIWLIRKVAMLFCTLLLAYYAYSFQDYNVINNVLLMQIQKQNLELKSYFETIGGSGLTNIKLMSPDVLDSLQKKKLANDSSDSDFSYDSDASDGTYVPSSGEEDTFQTAYSGLSGADRSSESLFAILPMIKQEIKSERPVSRASQGRSNTPVPVQSPYNLRSRRNSTRPSLNSSVTNESPEAFGRIVKQMERITRHNTHQVIDSVRKNQAPSYYSSDDE